MAGDCRQSCQAKAASTASFSIVFNVKLALISTGKVYCVCPANTETLVLLNVQVHKFGGTCVAAAERISEVAQLVADDPAEQRLVVVSAMGSHPSSPVKVTDLLLNMIAKASKQDQAFLIDLAALQVTLATTHPSSQGAILLHSLKAVDVSGEV